MTEEGNSVVIIALLLDKRKELRFPQAMVQFRGEPDLCRAYIIFAAEDQRSLQCAEGRAADHPAGLFPLCLEDLCHQPADYLAPDSQRSLKIGDFGGEVLCLAVSYENQFSCSALFCFALLNHSLL